MSASEPLHGQLKFARPPLNAANTGKNWPDDSCNEEDCISDAELCFRSRGKSPPVQGMPDTGICGGPHPTGEQWQSPAASVDRAKKRRLMHAAKDYLQELEVVVPYHRFDIVEVILKRNRGLVTIRHIAGAFVSEILSPQGNH